MLLELFHYVVTPAPRAHRRLGYLRDTISLGSRAGRCRRAWAPHLAATRDTIRAAIAGCAGRGTAVVLGSGYCHDVPLADLAAAFRRVVLVDAVHPWATRLRARRHPNVALLTADLSGSLDLLLGRAADLGPGLPPVCAAEGTDLVVSVNLLSQLPILPGERRGGAAAADLGRRIVGRHLAELAALRARICLVTDVEAIMEDRGGRVTDRLDLLHGHDPGAPDRHWAWDLAPFGEAARHHRIRHRVVAFADWRGAPATASASPLARVAVRDAVLPLTPPGTAAPPPPARARRAPDPPRPCPPPSDG
ncbi:hypothetical protein [Methylobacterium sp. ID0610]|uniref:hypothetical protein n=1 Tax=Methylobacterium carpenticola TaxID=3344827 RepID=UPI00369B044C